MSGIISLESTETRFFTRFIPVKSLFCAGVQANRRSTFPQWFVLGWNRRLRKYYLDAIDRNEDL